MTKTGRACQIFKPEFQFGLGGVPLGNEFEVVTDDDAMKTMEASWNAGVRYFDVSPWYGLGLAERRYGAFLHKQGRNSYLISTKIGKLLKAAPRNNSKELFPYANSPNNVVFDYTADGVKRSLEDSLQRLGIDHIDVVFVHDISSDNVLLPRPWPEEFAVALKGAFPALSEMRDEGIIKAWGIGARVILLALLFHVSTLLHSFQVFWPPHIENGAGSSSFSQLSHWPTIILALWRWDPAT